MIGDGELGLLRGDMAAWFREDAEVIHITQPTDQTTGRYVNTPTTLWTGKVNRKPASESAGGTREQVLGGSLQTSLSYWEFELPVGVPVQMSDLIVCGGRTYEVVGVLDKSLQIALYVYAQERSSGPNAG